jgi:hypothetical protein
MQTLIQTSRRLDSFLHEAAQNFELLSNIQDPNYKINKPTAVDALFKACPRPTHYQCFQKYIPEYILI